MTQPDLLNDKVSQLFAKYLAPSISATLVTSIYILADTVMIGRGVGAVGIAALNLLLPLFSVFFGTGMLFGTGGGVLLSISKGRGDERSAREYFTVACVCTALAAAVYLAAGNLFFDPVTKFLGRNASMDSYVREYGRVLVTGAPVFLCSALLQAFVRNDKAPKTAMTAVIAGGISNVALDYMFLFPMNMGMRGAAVATVLGSAVTVAILLTHFFTPGNTLKLVSGVKWKKAGEILVNGLASFLLELSNGVVIILFNRQLLAYVGDLGVVVYGIISNSALIVSSVCNGIAQAAQPILAVNYGAGKKERLKETRRLGELAAVAAGVLFAALGLIFPDAVAEAFVEPAPEILSMSSVAVRIYFTAFLLTGFNILSGTYFQSVMKPGYSLLICMMRGIILNSVLVSALPMALGVTGIWLTVPLTELFTMGICVALTKKTEAIKTYISAQ